MASTELDAEVLATQQANMDGKADRYVELVFQNRTWVGPILYRVLRRINEGVIKDPKDFLNHSSMSRLLNGFYKRPYHKGCYARYVSADGYTLPENAEWVE
jgi:hypothetical protein